MAEALTVVGAVASFIQLVDFTTKVCERVNHYIHRVDEAPENLRDIAIYLPLFIDSLRRTQFHIDFGHFNPQTSSALKILVDECFSQMNELDGLMTKLAPEQGDSKLTKARKTILSLKDEKTLERIFSKVKGYIEMLLLYQNSVTSTHTMANTKLVLKQIENASFLETATRMDSSTTEALVVDSKSMSMRSSTQYAGPKSLANNFKRNKQRRISYFMGLARFGLLWAFQADLDLSWGNYGFSISPSLHFQQLVKNTSLGYQVVFKSHFGEVDVGTSCGDLLRLFQAGTVSPWDIFPDGTTWLERLLKLPRNNPGLVLGLVRIWCGCSVPIRTKIPILSLVAKWNMNGIHLELLKELLSSGYDCSIDTTDTVLWEPGDKSLHGFCDSRPVYNCHGECEPFLLKFLVECSKNAYGVWGQTPLMDRILCGSKPEISNLLGHPHFLRGRNCLGQTATHVAVLRPDLLFTLLQFDVADIDGADFCGNSPLDYAAAYGYTDSVIELLKAGADPLEDGHLKFLHWAFFWDRWDVAKEAFAFFRATTRFSAAFLRSELHHFMGKVQGRGWRRSPELLETMLTLGVDKHIIFQNGNTLLHSATDSKWINCLFNAGFQEIDHRNNEGETALMKFILYQRDLRLVRHILTRGCSVNHRNNRGQTSLHGAFAQSRFSLPQRKQTFTLSFFDKITATHKFRFFDSISEGLATIARLLHHGADASIRDNCRCPCAPDGCSPVRKLLAGGKSKSYIWIMECLLMLIDVQGRTIAQKALFEINRVREFQLADMTHVCCNTADMTNVCSNALYYGTPMDDAEADEILDEEKEFVALLENKRGEAATSSDKNSIEKSWLSLISDFWIPNKPLKREKYMVRFNPQSMAGSGPGRALTSNNPLWNGKETLDFILAEEEEDNYWILLEGIDGHLMPQSSIYLAWVEWVYKNPEKYDYPFPVDRNWYERRKYWATRQAEVLDGLS